MPSINALARKNARTDAKNLVTVRGSSVESLTTVVSNNTHHRKQTNSSSSFPTLGVDDVKCRRSSLDLHIADEEPSENEDELPSQPPSPLQNENLQQRNPPADTNSETATTSLRLELCEREESAQQTRADSESFSRPISRPRALYRRSSSLNSLPDSDGEERPRNVRRCSSSPCASSARSRAGSGSSEFVTVNAYDIEDLTNELRHRSQVLGKSHPKVGLCWNLIGNAHFRRGEDHLAVDAYRRALSCHRAACGYASDDEEDEQVKGVKTCEDDDEVTKHLNLATTLTNLGAAHSRTGGLDEAVECLEWSLRIRLWAGKGKNEGRSWRLRRCSTN